MSEFKLEGFSRENGKEEIFCEYDIMTLNIQEIIQFLTSKLCNKLRGVLHALDGGITIYRNSDVVYKEYSNSEGITINKLKENGVK
jgi:hypothetical protein